LHNKHKEETGDWREGCTVTNQLGIPTSDETYERDNGKQKRSNEKDQAIAQVLRLRAIIGSEEFSREPKGKVFL
jgi:hypothetical protein